MKFYFDMDGVLANFNYAHPNIARLNHPGNQLNDAERAAKKQFWLNIEKQENFWHDMPLMKDSEKMINAAKQRGDIFILSKTPRATYFVGGEKYVEFIAQEKRQWVLEKLGKYFDDAHIIICNGPKGALMNPTQNDILIDDRPEHINEWIEHGGRGIVFKNVADTIKQIQSC